MSLFAEIGLNPFGIVAWVIVGIFGAMLAA